MCTCLPEIGYIFIPSESRIYSDPKCVRNSKLFQIRPCTICFHFLIKRIITDNLSPSSAFSQISVHCKIKNTAAEVPAAVFTVMRFLTLQAVHCFSVPYTRTSENAAQLPRLSATRFLSFIETIGLVASSSIICSSPVHSSVNLCVEVVPSA